MNIFLDTTVLFSDPFLKGNYNRNIIKLAKDYKDITFYMSDVVYKEAKRHFEKNVREHLKEFHKIERRLERYKRDYFITVADVEAQIEQEIQKLLNDFEIFYKELQEKELLHVLSCPDNILPELINRSVYRIKPFKENKSEFRDAVTWLTYVNYVEQNSLTDCYFITENVTDFFDEQKEGLHPDLLCDSKKLKPFINLKKLAQEDKKIKSYFEEKQGREQEILEWIDENNIDENYVLSYFKEFSANGLFNQIYDLCSDYLFSMGQIKLDGMYYNGEPYLNEIDVTNVQDFNIEVIVEEIIVSGELNIEANCEFREANKFDDIIMYNDIPFSLEFIQPFSFTLEMDEARAIINLQFEEIALIGNARIDPTIYF